MTCTLLESWILFSLGKVRWRYACIQPMCVMRVLHYIHQFFLSLRLLVARTWTLAYGRSALLHYYNPYARARTFISVLHRISAAPFPSNEQFLFHLISLSSNCHDQSVTLIPHLIPHTLYIYSHSRRRSPQCHRLCCFHIFFCLYCLVIRPAPLLSPWEQPFVLSAPRLCSAALITTPHVFFENFTHTYNFLISPPHPGFTIN